MKRINKFIYLWKLSVNYGQGYEYEIGELSFKEIKQRAKEYRENCPQYPIRVTHGRELNPEYKAQV
jgi:hypothetical protein